MNNLQMYEEWGKDLKEENSVKTFEEMGSGDMPACSCGKKKKKEKKQKKMKWTSEMIG